MRAKIRKTPVPSLSMAATCRSPSWRRASIRGATYSWHQIADVFPDQDEIFLDADEPVQLLRVRWNTTFADEAGKTSPSASTSTTIRIGNVAGQGFCVWAPTRSRGHHTICPTRRAPG